MLTAVHVALSLAGIVSGVVILAGFLAGRKLRASNGAFLATTILTSATGFAFPFQHLLPSHIVGALSLVVLALAIYAMYGAHLEGAWKRVYIGSAMVAFYFNVFVLVAQSFMKVPALHALAPTQAEPPFAIAQVAVLLLFIAAGTLAVRRSDRWPSAAVVSRGTLNEPAVRNS